MKRTGSRFFEAGGRILALAIVAVGGITLATLGGFSLGCGGGGGGGVNDDSGEIVDAKGWIPFKTSSPVAYETLKCDEATGVCGCITVGPKGGEPEEAYAVSARVDDSAIYIKAAIPYCAEFTVTFCGDLGGGTYDKTAKANPTDVTGDCTSDYLAVNVFKGIMDGAGVPKGAAYLISGEEMKVGMDAVGEDLWQMDQSGLSSRSATSLLAKHTVENDLVGSDFLFGGVLPDMDRSGKAEVALGRFTLTAGAIADLDVEMLMWLDDNLLASPQSLNIDVAGGDGIILGNGMDANRMAAPPIPVAVGDVSGDGKSDVLTLGYDLVGLMGSFVLSNKFAPEAVTQTMKLYTEGMLATPISLVPGEGEIWVNVAGVGDVNNDGIGDFAVTALTYTLPPIVDVRTPVALGSKVLVFLGVDLNPSDSEPYAARAARLAQPDVTITGQSWTDAFGIALRGGVDMDGDRVADLAVGAPAGFLSVLLTLFPTLAINGLEGLQDIGDYFVNGPFMKGAANPNATLLEKLASAAKARSVDEMMQGKVYVFPGGALFDEASLDITRASMVLSGQIEGDEAEANGLGHAMGQLLVTVDDILGQALCWDKVEGKLATDCTYKIGLEQLSRLPDTFGMSLAMGDFVGDRMGDLVVGAPTAVVFRDPNLVGQLIAFLKDELIPDIVAARDAGKTTKEILIETIIPDMVTELNADMNSIGKAYVFAGAEGAAAERGAAEADQAILGADAWGFGAWMKGSAGLDFTNDGYDDFGVGGFSMAMGPYPDPGGGSMTMLLLTQKSGFFFGGSTLAEQTSISLAPVTVSQDWTPLVIAIMDGILNP